MKILHVTQGYYPAIGGTEILIQRVSEELANYFGDEVTVFTTNCYSGEAFFTPRLPRIPIGWDEINGVRIRRFPVYSRVSRLLRKPQHWIYGARLPGNQHLRALSGGPIIPGLTKAIRRYPADVISASSFPLLHMFAALEGALSSGRPAVLHGGLHPMDDWGFQRPMIYQAIQRATRYIAITDYEAQYVIERGAEPERVVSIGVGVDPEPFQAVSTEEAKRRLGVEGKPVVGFIGQLGGHKGVDTLIRAMPLVWQVVPDAHILVAGARTLFADQLERIIDRHLGSQRDKLILCYNFRTEEKPWLFGAVDVFAYPSGYESFGVSFLEAWAAGKPVIGCRAGAVPWVVQAGRDGLLVDFQNEAMLAEAIILLLTNPGWTAALGAAGREKVLARYTWREIARRFRLLYESALEEKEVLV